MMNLEKTQEYNQPFKHWEIFDCLDKSTLDEISFSEIPEGQRSYDGTRAADNTGQGIDGKLRLFVTIENSKNFPNLTKLINQFQNYKIYSKISSFLKKDLSKSFVRLEIISDKKGFWLKPHKDIKEKLMTMMIWSNPYNESEKLGTDMYNDNYEIVKTVKYSHNNGYFFSSGEDTWHGLEKKDIVKERRCIQINYVSFKTDWPVIN
tara:strand:- start:518 stop:1135 length:618 start_codon:yes stop_codon:yes gene_type:complete